jgi:hypothetical protein
MPQSLLTGQLKEKPTYRVCGVFIVHSSMYSPYASSYWATLYTFELRNILWATLHPNWATHSTFVQFF